MQVICKMVKIIELSVSHIALIFKIWTLDLMYIRSLYFTVVVENDEVSDFNFRQNLGYQ